MRIENGAAALLGGPKASVVNKDQNGSLTSLANKQVARSLGIHEGRVPGSYKPVYSAATTREIKEDVVETRDLTRLEPVYADRAVTEMRDLFEERAVMGVRDVFEERAITEARAIMEARAVYEDRTIQATRVEGDQKLAAHRYFYQTQIDTGADFSVKVGDGTTSIIKFESSSRISVTTGTTTARFNFSSTAGSFATTLASALDSVAGLSAGLTADGRLKLETDNAQSLKIAEVANSFLDFSGSPLAAIGLKAGTVQAAVVGSERVQTGAEQVVVGTQTVQVGTERVVVGSESYQIGTEQVRTGSQSVVVGFERVKVGDTPVIVGSERVVTSSRVRNEIDKGRIVGLERTEYGIGEALDRLAFGPILPAGYLEALFGPIQAPGVRDTEPHVRAAYAMAVPSSGSDKSAQRLQSRPERDDVRLPKT